MASDSDVEAYLNQLSQKTHRLKQDSRPWEDSLSSLSGADHLPIELSASSDLPLQVESGEPKTHPQKKAATGGLISDITALSEKYSFSTGKKSASKDRFSTLEEKYLKKYNTSGSLKSHKLSKETKQRKNLAEKNEVRDKAGTKFDIHVAAKEKKTLVHDVNSSEEIDDENLAHYLSEVTLTSEKYVSDKDTNADNSTTDDSVDDVLNLKNVIDVEDILGEEENSGRSVHLSPVHHSAESNVSAGKNDSQPESKFAAKSQDNEAKIAKDEQTEASRGINILSASKSSLFYSSRQKEEEEEKHHPPVRLLLSQPREDVFHSSWRKSSVEFSVINEGKVKPRKSSKQSHKRKTKGRHKSTSEGSVASASESQISEQVPGSGQSEDDLASEGVASGGTEEPTVASQVEEDSQVSTSASTVKSEGSKQHGLSSQTKHAVDASSQERSHKKHTKSPSTKDHKSEHRRKNHKQSYDHDHKGRKGQKTSHRKRKETKRITRKSRKKHRSPSSSSSSSPSSSSESSYSTSEPVQHRPRSHRRFRRAAHDHWNEPHFLQRGVWPCCCLHAGHAASAHTLPAFTGGSSNVLPGSGLGMQEVMQQQVALIRQFLDSQQMMYQAYTSTLISSYHYTSLRHTEKYMKKRKPPLTFPEAYRLVKEEMEASER